MSVMPAEDVTVPATDGFPLGATLFRPQSTGGSAGPFVIIASGTGIRRRFYANYAAYLCDRGFSVLTFDYRGIGDSRPASLFGFQATMRDWGEKDLAGVIDWIAATLGAACVLLVGHSAGAQLLGLAANNRQIGAMLSVAGQSGYWGNWPPPRKYLVASLWYVLVPAVTAILPWFPSSWARLGEDLPGGVARQLARWCRHPDYMVDDAGTPLRSYFIRFRAPIRYYSFDDDHYAPRKAVQSLMSWYSFSQQTGRHVRPSDFGLSSIGHFGFFRAPDGLRLWPETAEWLIRQVDGGRAR